MFPLHYKTRRFLCRVAFVLLCGAPTAGVLAWAGWRGTDSYVAVCRRDLEHQTGYRVQLSSLRHPQPGISIFEGLTLCEPRSNTPVLYFPRLEVSLGNGKCVAIATGPEVDERLLPRVPELLARLRYSSPGTITFVAASLLLKGPAGEQMLKRAELRLAQTTVGDEWGCRFWREADAATQPISVTVSHSHETPDSMHLELDTADGTLPCSWLQTFFPMAGHWGAEATYQGTVKLDCDTHGWHGQIRGVFRQVDLAQAISKNFPHRIEGPADIYVHHAEIAASRLVHTSGSVDAGPGLIGPSLRIAAAEALELPASEVALQTAGLLEYEQLAFDFQISAQGVALSGRCQQAPAGALLVDRQQLLLGQPRRQPQPLAGIVRTLAAPQAQNVPASHQASWLLNLLPLGN